MHHHSAITVPTVLFNVSPAAALGPVSLAAHTIVKQIIDFAMAIFGCFSTVAQSLVATCLGKVKLQPELPMFVRGF